VNKASNKQTKNKSVAKIGTNRIYFNDGVCVLPSTKGGRGVFARKCFKKGDIVEIAPAVVVRTNNQLLMHTELEHYIFEGDGGVLIGLGYTSLYNHKMVPNAEFDILDDMIIITARENIDKGDEIFVNYGWDSETLQCAGIID
jgi:hypothetical protein